ncbi:MAG: hypothetical protein FGM58_09545 [Acidimicrobiia bacterium]|nr:hypothetical protein [Acidimicrobiia bacterium]
MAIVVALASCTTSSKPADRAVTTTTAPAPTASTTSTTMEPESGVGRLSYVYGPSVGDCIDLRSMATGRAVTTRATPAQDATQKSDKDVILRLGCDLPHQYEVMAVLDAGLPRDPAPTLEQLAAVARKRCPSTFETFVGIGYPESALEIGWILPSPEQFGRGVQTFGCLAYEPGGKMTGSVRGSRR